GAVRVPPTSPAPRQEALKGARGGPRRFGLEVKAGTPDEIETAFATAIEQRPAWLSAHDVYFESRRDQIAALGLRHALPTISGGHESVRAGTLMSYGSDGVDLYRPAGA